MLYVIYGNDNKKTREKLHELLDLAKKKRPEAEVFKINTENWSESQLDELLISQGLFSQKYTTVLDNLFENKEAKQFLVSKLSELKDSEQIFLMIENTIDSNTLKKLEKFAEKIQEFQKNEAKQEVNVFEINNHLIKRDKKKLWISYLDLLSEKIPAEEIHGIIFWQIKNMIIASKTKESSSSLSPFVYKNALSGVRNYKEEELEKMSNGLLNMTYKVRSGDGELEVMLEKWILSL